MKRRIDVRKTGHIPMRMCVACGRKLPKAELARYTCPAEYGRGLELDATGKRPGRGFYLCPDDACASKFPKYKGWLRKCKGEANDQ